MWARILTLLVLTSLVAAPPSRAVYVAQSPALGTGQTQCRGTAADAEKMNATAIKLKEAGSYLEAVHLAECARNTYESAPDKDERRLGIVLANLASLYTTIGRYERAEPLLRKAKEYLRPRPPSPEEPFGGGHVAYAGVLRDMSILFAETGRYDEAESALSETLEMHKKLIKQVGSELFHVEITDAALENDKEWFKYFEFPLVTHFVTDYANDLTSLGALYLRMGLPEKAGRVLNNAKFILENAPGAEATDYADVLNSLAGLREAQGRYEEEGALLKGALSIMEEHLPAGHPKLATVFSNLATWHHMRGEHEQAERLYSKAREIFAKGGEDNPLYAATNFNLALLYQREGRHNIALKTYLGAMEIEQRNLRGLFDVSSEAAMESYLATLRGSYESLLSMLDSQRRLNPRSPEIALLWTLRRKAVIFDSIMRFKQAQKLAADNPNVAARLGLYHAYRQELSNLPLLAASGGAQQAEQRSAALRSQINVLEEEINRLLPSQSAAGGVEEDAVAAVRSRLAPDSALVEFVRVQPYDFQAKTRESVWKSPQYYAFVLHGDEARPPSMINLGDAAAIDREIKQWRSQLLDFQRKWEADTLRLVNEANEEAQLAKTGGKLHRLVFAPLERELSGKRLIYLAPDGQLNLLPFGALPDASGGYLLDKYSFAYLTSGRDLLRTVAEQAAGATAFTDPDYDMTAAARARALQEFAAAAQGASRPPRSLSVSDLHVVKGKQLRGGPWKSLRGAKEEAASFEREMGGVGYRPLKTYTQQKAMEEIFKRQPAPRVLHIGTHGFFPEETDAVRLPDGPLDLRTGSVSLVGQRILQRAREPLLHSGLVMAGANNISDGAAPSGSDGRSAELLDDGWLTAEEIALMRLAGTEMVVLSACGTGLGELSAGEGVYGLRRGFQLAGAQSVVSTLFAVPDAESSQLVKSFYSHFGKKGGKLAALHAAQRAILAERRKKGVSTHPFFWAGFVFAGTGE